MKKEIYNQNKANNFSLSSIYINNLLPYFIFAMSFVVMSPLFNLFGWRGIYNIILIGALSAIFIFMGSLKIKKWFLYLVFIVFITSAITSIYWNDLRYLLANIFLIFAMFLMQYATKNAINKVVTLATWFFSLLLIGAAIGYILAFLGIKPLLQFPNPDGRANYFFYTTLTNVFAGNWIRPSGIYDEPGALSLYVCAVAAARHLLCRDNKATWFMLLLGFITFSLAHLIYVFFHLISENFTRKNIRRFTAMGVLAVTIVFATGLNKTIEVKLIQRLAIDETTGSIKGDNRSFRIYNATKLMKENHSIIFFGGDPSCRFEYSECKKLFPPIGENPLTPLFTGGLFISWPYYLIIAAFLMAPLKNKKTFVLFGFAFLMMQRPSVLYLSGATATAFLVYLYFISVKTQLVKKTLHKIGTLAS